MNLKKIFIVLIICFVFTPDVHNFVQAEDITVPIPEKKDDQYFKNSGLTALQKYKKAFSQNREIAEIANNINYDITNFDVSDDNQSFIFEGWSYIDHMDNIGGENLRTWIIAYTGEWNKEWDKAIVYQNTLVKNGHYYATLTDFTDKDLFYSRANSWVGVIKQLDRVHSTNYKWKNFGDHKDSNPSKTGESSGRNGVYTIDWCLQLSTSLVKFDTDSRCLYHNVGFEVSIDTTKISDILGAGGAVDVKFRILSSTYYQQNSTCGYDFKCSDNTKWRKYEKYESIDLGVYSSSLGDNLKPYCSVNGDRANCERTETIDTDDGTFESTLNLSLNGFAQYLQITANGVHPYTDDKMTSKLFAGNEYFKSVSYGGSQYPIKGISSGDKTICLDKEKKKCYDSRVFKIGMSSRTITGTSPYKYFIVGGNDITGWVPASWTIVSGSLTLKNFKTTSPCEKSYCIGGACDENKTGDGPCPKYNPSTKLQGVSCKNNSQHKQCSDASFTTNSDQCTKKYSAQYYYRISKNDILTVFDGLSASIVKNNGNTVLYANDYYYFPIQFRAIANFSQSSQFNIVKGGTAGVENEVISGSKFVSGTTIAKAGRNFNYAFNYTVDASWNYNGTYRSETSVNNTYGSKIKVRLDNGNTIVVYVSLKEGDQLWYKNGSNWVSTTYNVNLYKDFVSQGVLKDYKQGALDVSVLFSDSNDANSDEMNEDAGIYSCIYSDGTSWNPGTSKSASCTYRIKQAYIGRQNADVIYKFSSSEVNLNKYDIGNDRGSLYYVPLNLKSGEQFQFRVLSSKLSLVKGVNYTYSATCSVNINNEYYKVRYRPIDTSNPFPEGETSNKLAYNWKLYKNIDPNFLRIKERSFSKIYYKTKKFSNSQIDSLENFANLYGDYLSNADIEETSGNSKIITNSLFDVINRSSKTHCISGNFNKDCDQG